MTDFGDVRAAFARATYVEQWSHLVWALSEFQGEGVPSDVLEYARAIVTRWPVEVEREAPFLWLEAWWQGAAHDALQLANLFNCTGMKWGASLVNRLIEDESVHDLRSLYLWDTDVGEGAWPELLALPWRNLATLDLGGNTLRLPEKPLSPRTWPSLESLTLSQCKGAEGVLAWLLCDADVPVLREVRASAISLGMEDLAVLGDSMLPDMLVRLFLGRNRIDDHGLEVLFRRPWRALERLDLGDNPLGDVGVERLAKADFSSLKHLAVTHVGMTTRGLRALLASEWITNVETLVLANNLLDDEALDLLANAEDRLGNLRDLRTMYNQAMSQEVQRRVAATPWLQQCEVLEL